MKNLKKEGYVLISVDNEFRNSLWKCKCCDYTCGVLGIKGHYYLKHTKEGKQHCINFGESGKVTSKRDDVRKKIQKKQRENYKNKSRFRISKWDESDPEKKFKECIEHFNLPFDVLQYYSPEEYDRAYEMDFAIPELRIYFEVNGGQHYTSNGEFTKYHLERKEYIESFGWKQIDVDYSICFNESILKDLIFNALSGNYKYSESTNRSVVNYRLSSKNKNKEIETLKKLKSGELVKYIDDEGTEKIVKGWSLFQKELLENYKRILEFIVNTDTDFTKFGWVSEVSRRFVDECNTCGYTVIKGFPLYSKMTNWLKDNCPQFLNYCYVYNRDRIGKLEQK